MSLQASYVALITVAVYECKFVVHERTGGILQCIASALSCTASPQKSTVNVPQRIGCAAQHYASILEGTNKVLERTATVPL